MRVISGSAKGRTLQSVPGDSTRPITDRVKEALFNIFGADMIDACFLDLFGGTGGVGIEALSRGAAQAVFVEKNRKAQETIKANLLRTQLSDRGEIVRGDAFAYLRGVPQPFHYIYIAPPQYHRLWVDALNLLDEQPGWLADDGEIIVQVHPKEHEAVALEHFEEIEQRRYSSTLLMFYTHRTEDDGPRTIDKN
jgi:16S rRNA (guanine966-N2)-methyltransferase